MNSLSFDLLVILIIAAYMRSGPPETRVYETLIFHIYYIPTSRRLNFMLILLSPTCICLIKGFI